MASRRRFLAASAAAGVAVGASRPAAGRYLPGGPIPRNLLELRRYRLADPARKQGLEWFLRHAAIPGWNRQKIDPVGVFYPEGEALTILVLLRHLRFETVVESTAKLLEDQEFLRQGAAWLDAPDGVPASECLDSSLLRALFGMPELRTPVRTPGRVLQLGVEPGPGLKSASKRCGLFNDAEALDSLRRAGFSPVFLGEAISGERLPNLTYLLASPGREGLQASWKALSEDDKWKALTERAGFADGAALQGARTMLLEPADYSQV